MLKTIFGWVGTLMTTVAVAAAQSYYSSHSIMALRILIASAIAAVICGSVYFLSNRPEKASGTIQKTTGDNSPIGGSGITTGGNINGSAVNAPNSYFNFITHSPQITQNTYSEYSREHPNLVFPGGSLGLIRHDGSHWRTSSKGDIGIVVWVENLEQAELHQQASPAHGVTATIRFKVDDLTVGLVDRAYWLDTASNKIDILPGTKSSLVLGTYKSWQWSYCSNPRTTPFRMPAYPFNDIKLIPGAPKEQYLSLKTPVRVEITIQSASFFTLAKHAFILSADSADVPSIMNTE